jgi:hypothetical protein
MTSFLDTWRSQAFLGGAWLLWFRTWCVRTSVHLRVGLVCRFCMRPGVALDAWGWALRESAGVHPDEMLLRQVFDSAGLPIGRQTCGRAGWPAASLMPQSASQLLSRSCCCGQSACQRRGRQGRLVLDVT